MMALIGPKFNFEFCNTPPTTHNSPEVPLGCGFRLRADNTRQHQEHCEFEAHFVQFELNTTVLV